MKKKWNFVFIGSILLLASEHKLLAEEKESQNSLYSSTNRPTIYGTKYIQIHNEDELSLLNPKYRVWADDFEDGDITNQIKVVSIDGKEPEQMITKEGKVHPLKEGKHQIHYQVMDKDHNISEFTTEIDVLSTPHDKSILEDEIVKSVLKKPKAEYTDKVGMKRGDEGDRQLVGVQLEPGQSIETKVLEDEELQLNLLTEDRKKDVYEKVNGTEYKKFSPKEAKFELVYGRTSSSDTTAVPFINTPRYDAKDGIQNQTVDVHYKIGHDIRTVPYWHEGDNEQTFFDQWKKDAESHKKMVVKPKGKQDTTIEEIEAGFSVIDGEYAQFLTPNNSRAYVMKKFDQRELGYQNNDPDKTLLELMKRYQKLSNFYDEMIGVSLNPTEKYNQRIPSKYFMRADGNGAGSAYYLPGWIAMNSDHLTGFWSLEWGTLHEIAHGYQGWINNDPYIYLREISNNILSYAAQHNEEILPNQSSYWVDLKNNEKDMQGLRRRVMREVIPKTKEEYEDPSKVTLWQNFAQKYDLRYNLYTLLNLLDTFGNIKETFGRVNSQIREDSLKNPHASSEMFNRQIFYAFSKYYQVDITPYMLSWGMTRLPETEEIYQMQKAGDHLVTLEDVIYDEKTRKEVREKLNCRDLSPVKTSDLLSLNIPGKAKLKIEGSAFENIKGKAILIKNAGKVVRSVPVTSEEMEIELPVGVYTIEMPIPDDKGYQYSNKTQYLFSTNQEEKHSPIAQYYTTFEYKEKKKKVQSKDSMVVLGKNKEGKQGAAFQLGLNPRSDRPVNDLVVQINPEFKAMDTVQFDIYRQVMPDTEIFTGQIDRTYKAEKGGAFEEIKHNQKPSQVGNGDILAVTTTEDNFENIRNYNEQGVEYLFNRPKETTTYYRMTNRGFKEVHLTDQEVEDALYEQEKVSIIEELKEKIAQLEPEDFTSKFKQKQLKSDIYALYYSLKEKDQVAFAEVIEALKKGGKPEITFKSEFLNENKQIIIEQGKESEIQWLDYIQVLDPEDGYITPNNSNTSLSWKEGKKSQPKTYQLTYTVTDLDGNQSSKSIDVVALPKKDFIEEEMKKVQLIIQKMPFLSEEQRLHWLTELETSYTKNDLQEILMKATKENEIEEEKLKKQTIENINTWSEFNAKEKEQIKQAIEKVEQPKDLNELLEKLKTEKEKRWQNGYQQAQEQINQYEFLSEQLKGEIQSAIEQAKTIEELQHMMQYAKEKNDQAKANYIHDIFVAWEKEVDCSEKEKEEVKKQLTQCQTKLEMHKLLKEKTEQWDKELISYRLEVISIIKTCGFLDTDSQQKLIQKAEVEKNIEALKEIEKEVLSQNEKEKEKVQNLLYQLLDEYITIDKKEKERLQKQIEQIKTKEEAEQLEDEIHNLGEMTTEQWKNWQQVALKKIQTYSFLTEKEKEEANKQIKEVTTKEKLLEQVEYYYSLNEARKKEARKELTEWINDTFSKWDKNEVQQMLEKIPVLNTKEELIHYQKVLQFYKTKKEVESFKKYFLMDIDNNEFLTQEEKSKKKEEVHSLIDSKDCFSWWMDWLKEKETQLKNYREQMKMALSQMTYLSPKQLSFYSQQITKAENKKAMDTILHQAKLENELCREEKLQIRKQAIIRELNRGQLPNSSIHLWKEKIQQATTISQLSKIQQEMKGRETSLWEEKKEMLLVKWKQYALFPEQEKEISKALEACDSYTKLEQLEQKALSYHQQNEKPIFIKDSGYVQLKNKSILWNDLLCKDKKSVATLHKIYKVKGYYQIGNKILATLYDNKNQWQGYAELDNTKVLATPGGQPIQKEFYISINDDYPLWNDLNFNKKRNRAKKGNILKVKRYYQHFNGKTYLSVYNYKDQWQGYINANAVNITLNKGKLPVKPYQKVAKYEMIVRNNYTLWDDLTFKKKKGNTKKLLKEQVWVDKKYQHFNGSTYYSIYKDKSKKKWLGYVNSNAFKKS